MDKFTSTSFFMGDSPIEMYKKDTSNEIARAGGSPSECNLWLPFAAREYHLSPRLEDYILVPVPAIYNDIPNTNGDCVKLAEMLRFDPDMGMQAFKTFRGKPCFEEHANRDITKASGVILDCFIRPLKNFGKGKYYKVVLLHAFDRSKAPIRCNDILTGKSNAYSVGFYHTSFECSICGKYHTKDTPECGHTSLKPGSPVRRTYLHPSGKLAYRFCRNMRGFESSAVADPAFIIAHNDFNMPAWR